MPRNVKQNAGLISSQDLEEFVQNQPMNASSKDIIAKALVHFKGLFTNKKKGLLAFKKRISRVIGSV